MSDLISRSRILKIIETWMKVPSYNESERNIMRAFYYEVKTTPFEGQKSGRWGKHGECPFCGYIRQFKEDNYCANCGARLKVSE